MPLTVTMTGNRAYVTGDGFAFTATQSGDRVEITGVDRTVVATFADPQANIQRVSNTYSISSSSFLTSWRGGQQHHMPGEIDHSMKDVTDLSAVYLGTDVRSVSFTTNYLFACFESCVVGRRSLATTSPDYVDLSADVDDLSIIAYSDDITYVFGKTADSFVVYKIDWTTETATLETEIHTTYPTRTIQCCARARDGASDVFICTGLTYPDVGARE